MVGMSTGGKCVMLSSSLVSDLCVPVINYKCFVLQEITGRNGIIGEQVKDTHKRVSSHKLSRKPKNCSHVLQTSMICEGCVRATNDL